MIKRVDNVPELDVRVIPPRDKHPTIFRTFEKLLVGEAFDLMNDHDPFPLRYQFEAERPGEFVWTYIETGPETWRVRISRSASAPAYDRTMPGGGCARPPARNPLPVYAPGERKVEG